VCVNLALRGQAPSRHSMIDSAT